MRDKLQNVETEKRIQKTPWKNARSSLLDATSEHPQKQETPANIGKAIKGETFCRKPATGTEETRIFSQLRNYDGRVCLSIVGSWIDR
jgi:hypothetical protein